MRVPYPFAFCEKGWGFLHLPDGIKKRTCKMCPWNPTLAAKDAQGWGTRRLETSATSAIHFRVQPESGEFVATLRQPAFDSSPIAVRKARAEDAPVCGRICYEAFTKISTDHGFP